MSTSKLGTIPPSGTNYFDLRDEFVRILWCKLRHLDQNIRNDQKFVRMSLVRAITQIALHPDPLKTVQTAQQVDGVGEKWVQILDNEKKKNAKTKKWHGPPLPGKFASPASAVLVTLLESTTSPCSCHDVIERAGAKLESGRSFGASQTIKSGDQTDSAWDQVRVLMAGDESRKLVKQRKVNKIAHFELTPLGHAAAIRLKDQNLNKGAQSSAMHSGNENNGPVKLLVDFREGGGEKKRLFELCGHLERQGVPFEVPSHLLLSHLKQARDNLRSSGRITVFPLIVERKEASDVALSMIDGRWKSQQKRMREKAQDPEFAGVKKLGQVQHVNLVYTIEGGLKSARVKCCDRDCLYKHGGPSLLEAEAAVEKLKGDGYHVVETNGLFQTAAMLGAKVKALSQPYLPSTSSSASSLAPATLTPPQMTEIPPIPLQSPDPKAPTKRSVHNSEPSSKKRARQAPEAIVIDSDSDEVEDERNDPEIYSQDDRYNGGVEETAVDDKEVGGLEWACVVCTFENKEQVLVCEMCASQRPGSSSLSSHSCHQTDSFESQSHDEHPDIEEQLECEVLSSSDDESLIDLLEYSAHKPPSASSTSTQLPPALPVDTHLEEETTGGHDATPKVLVSDLKRQCREAGLISTGSKSAFRSVEWAQDTPCSPQAKRRERTCTESRLSQCSVARCDIFI